MFRCFKVEEALGKCVSMFLFVYMIIYLSVCVQNDMGAQIYFLRKYFCCCVGEESSGYCLCIVCQFCVYVCGSICVWQSVYLCLYLCMSVFLSAIVFSNLIILLNCTFRELSLSSNIPFLHLFHLYVNNWLILKTISFCFSGRLSGPPLIDTLSPSCSSTFLLLLMAKVKLKHKPTMYICICIIMFTSVCLSARIPVCLSLRLILLACPSLYPFSYSSFSTVPILHLSLLSHGQDKY